MSAVQPRLLRTRLLIAFVAVGVPPLFLVATYFAVFSYNFVNRLYSEQASQHVAAVAGDLEETLLAYRRLTYVLSENATIISVLADAHQPDRETALRLYPVLYRALDGNLDGAALHLASLTDTPSLSTHQFPSAHQPVASREGIYRSASAAPRQTAVITRSFANATGETVNFSLVKAVIDEGDNHVGFVVADLFKGYLSDRVRQRNGHFFMDVVVTDNAEYRVVDLLHPENDGTYEMFPHLIAVGTSDQGVTVSNGLVIGWQKLLDGAFTVVGSLPMETALGGVKRLIATSAWLILSAAVVSTSVATFMARSISSPIHRLAAAMERVELGDLDVVARTNRRDEIGVLFHGFNRMLDEIRDLLAKTVDEQEQLRQAEQRFLQAQINPHFLYNTLGTIKSIAKCHDVPEIATIVTELSRLLRAATRLNDTSVSIAESLELVRSFIRIHDVRHPGRYTVMIDVEAEVLPQTVPALTLQPLVENAFVHGLEGKPESGNLIITGRREGDETVIIVADDGIGFDPTTSASDDTHIGIANVRRRLSLMFGDRAGVTISSVPMHGTTVRICVPWMPTREVR